VDLVRVHPEMHRQLGDGPVAPDCRYRHLRWTPFVRQPGPLLKV
jgi:hypothetical protein